MKLTLAMRQCPPDAAFVGKILGTKIESHIFLGHSHYHLVLTNSSPWKPWPIEIDGLPVNSMVILTMAMLNNQMVSQRNLSVSAIKTPIPTRHAAHRVESRDSQRPAYSRRCFLVSWIC